jgi:hypothetical protein
MTTADKASLLTMAPLFKQLADIAQGPSVECAVAGTRKPFDTARPNPLASEFFQAMTDLLTAAAPQPAPVAAPVMVWCTACGGSGEGHSAYADTVCNACDGVGKRRADWRTLPDGDLEDY